MKKIFFQLYETNIVFEDGFLFWRENLALANPGKAEALLQVAEFFAWLETSSGAFTNASGASGGGAGSSLGREIQEQLDSIESYLIPALKAQPPVETDDLCTWLRAQTINAQGASNRIMRCVLGVARKDPFKVPPILNAIADRAALLKLASQPEGAGLQIVGFPQAVLLTQVMVFCRTHDRRLGRMHKFFFQLYQKDVVFADGFRYWCVALPDTTPRRRGRIEVGEFFGGARDRRRPGHRHHSRRELVLAASIGGTEQLSRVLSPWHRPRLPNSRMHGALRGGQRGTHRVRPVVIKAKATVDLMAVTDATSHGVSPLCVACRLGRVDSVRLLLEAKAQVDLDNGHGETGLSACALGSTTDEGQILARMDEDKNVECARLLLEAGATIHLTDPILHLACKAPAMRPGHTMLKYIRVLLDALADPNGLAESEGTDNPTPIFLAAQKGDAEAVEMLLNARASVVVRNRWGKTPIIIAQEECQYPPGRAACVELLQAASDEVAEANMAAFLAEEDAGK